MEKKSKDEKWEALKEKNGKYFKKINGKKITRTKREESKEKNGKKVKRKMGSN